MSFSDWLQIALSLVGFVVGAVISWVFYRAQQQADYNKLLDRMSKIGQDVATIKSHDSITSTIGLDRTLAELRRSVETLSMDMNSLSTKILADIRGEQRDLLRTVQAEFTVHVEQSRRVLEQSMSRELSQIIPPDGSKEAVINRLVDLFKHAAQSLGEFQRTSIEKQSEIALGKVENKVSESVGEVSDDVKGIRLKLQALPLSLARP